MAKDFRADRIRISAIVGTGSVGFTRSAASAGGASALPHLGLLVYSSSKAADFKGGRLDTRMLDNVGSDVWLVVSGSRNNSAVKNSQKAAGSSVLFQGDVVVSGTLWAERSVVEVDDSTVGNFRIPNKLIQGFQTGSTDAETGTALILSDPYTANPDGGNNGTGTVSFKKVAGSSGNFTYPAASHGDVFFHVSGSRGVRNTNDRGIALFDGDVHVSGNLSTDPLGTVTIGADMSVGANLMVTGNLYLSGNDIYDSGNNLVLSFDGQGNIDHFAMLTGSGENAGIWQLADREAAFISLTRQENKTTTTTLTSEQTVGKVQFRSTRPLTNAIQEVSQIKARAIDPYTNTNMGTSLDFSVTPPGTRALERRLQLIDTYVVVSGGLKISPVPDVDTEGTPVPFAGIIDDDNIAVLTLSGSGNATFNKNLTILGDLNVSGSTTTIDTTNLKVKDQLIILATGSTGPNVKGGIAIASGSDQANKALVWGAGNTANSFRASIFDVEDGNKTTDLGTQELALIEASGLILSRSVNSFRLSGSAGGDGLYNITGSKPNGGILWESTNRDISLKAGTSIDLAAGAMGIRIKDDRPLYIDGETQTAKIDSNGATSLRFTHMESAGKFRFDGSIGLGTHLVFGSSVYGETPMMIRSYDQRVAPANMVYRDILQISGSGRLVIENKAAEGAYGLHRPAAVVTVISQSANEPGGGGPNIILSSSTEFSGGTSREGFLSLGVGSEAQVAQLFTAARHRDVRTILSGTVGSTNSNTRGVTLVAGDLVTSGNVDLKGTVTLGALSLQNLTLDSVSSQEPYIRFRNNTTQIRRNVDDLELSASNGSGMMRFVDTVTGPHTLQDLASLSVVDNTDVFTIDGGEPSFVKTTGSFSFDTSNRYSTVLGSDTYFFVSGAIGSKDTANRGTATFGGDMMVSGTMRMGVPLFVASLNTAYNTPDVMGGSTTLTAGGGAVIDLNYNGTLGRPIQIKGNTAASDSSVLALTGSLTMRYGGGGNNSRILMETDNALEFHNSAGEVFRMTAGSSGTNARFENNNQLRFQDDSRYIYGLTQDSVKKLRLHNNSTGGSIVLSTTNGRAEVTGSLYPGADNTYDLGSPDYRWANVYTGDLHLRNERGNWTIYEEPDMLVVVNNLTGKKYKMGLTPLEDEE